MAEWQILFFPNHSVGLDNDDDDDISSLMGVIFVSLF
jgi:hypothetical protein